MKENPNKFVHAFAALADLGQEVAHTNSFQEMIRTSLHLLLGSLAIMRGGVARYARFGREMNFLAMRGMGEDFPLCLQVTRDDEKEWVANGFAPFDLDDGLNCLTPFLLRYKNIFEARGIELVVPLIVRDELVGLILLGEKANGEPFSAHDKEVVCAMARHIGVGIQHRNLTAELERRAEENRLLYDGMRLTYKDTVKAFAAAIDFKDKYTEGHSVRVGKYSEIIASELGWEDERVEGVAISGYLHDVGKLVVDKNIINSAQRITVSENAQLLAHPSVGYEILTPIHHPYADVPLAARHHHERLDGRGYPDGLSDREIPYIGKIVCLADSFDAMTTDRPYRRRRTAREAIEDLQLSAGKQFAPELVTAFCRAMLKEVTGESKVKRFSKLLGDDYLDAPSVAPLLKNVLNGISPTSSLTLVSLD